MRRRNWRRGRTGRRSTGIREEGGLYFCVRVCVCVGREEEREEERRRGERVCEKGDEEDKDERKKERK